MHELSIAQNIVEIIQKQIPEPEWDLVSTVRLKIGKAAGIVPDSLEFSFQAITADSSLSHARLEIESIPFRIHCYNCGTITENEAGFTVCDKCGSADTKILSGSELQIAEIEVIEPEKEVL